MVFVKLLGAQTAKNKSMVFVKLKFNNVRKDNSLKMAFVLKSAQVPS